MNSKNRLEETVIPLQEAIVRTNLWRQVFTETFQVTDPNKIFRGFRIPIEDIQQLASDYSTENIQYVRAYLSAVPNVPPDPTEGPYEFSIVLVPVDAAGNDILSHEVGGVSKSAIYDFTQPCPPCCDINSPLYNSVAEQQK